jgi:rhamnogalacturonan endolyase
MFSLRWLIRLLGVFLCVARAAFAADSAPVTATDTGTSFVLDNGLVSLMLAKKNALLPNGQPARNGEGISLQYKDGGTITELSDQQRAFYFDIGGDRIYPVADADGQIINPGPDRAEVAYIAEPGDLPFHVELHVVMPRGERGFYLYAIYRHDATMARGNIGETRFVLRGAPGTSLFTNHVVDDDRMGPFTISPMVRQLQDVTTLREDGSIYTKYNNSAYNFDHHVHGMAGNGYGLWMIIPSNEAIGGGPFKQELTVHMGNTLLSMFVGGHFGTRGLSFDDGEVWSKLYGPVFVYLNKGRSVDELWADAKNRAAAEIAQWPYAWLNNPDYPLDRGTVSGHLSLADGAIIPPAPLYRDAGNHFSLTDGANGTWAILSPVNEAWAQVLKGYDYWSQVDAQGNFSISKIRPGLYQLTFIGADQFEELHVDKPVEVKAGATSLGNIVWHPLRHGQTLWQIGTADRLAFEFKNGSTYRHFENFVNYLKDFPNDVTYVIGQSKESQDWNFAQFAVYNKKPYWTIQFDQPQPLKGAATLTIGFTSVDPHNTGATDSNSGERLTDLLVKVNGQQISDVQLRKTGTAGYRSGSSDSNYSVVYLPFDASLLKPGPNEITLGFANALKAPADPLSLSVPPEVMYDALRLEVDPTAMPPVIPPTTTAAVTP